MSKPDCWNNCPIIALIQHKATDGDVNTRDYLTAERLRTLPAHIACNELVARCESAAPHQQKVGIFRRLLHGIASEAACSSDIAMKPTHYGQEETVLPAHYNDSGLDAVALEMYMPGSHF